MKLKPHFESVDDYIGAQPVAVQRVLERVRRAIRKTVPEASEIISYQMPTYMLKGKRILYFAAWSRHYALYAATPKLVAQFRDELAPYKVDKGTIRFPLSEPVPVRLIERLARFRASEVQSTKRAGPR